jgi:Cu+-exporting ATPase
VVSGAQERNLRLSNPENFRALTGQGVVGRVEGRDVAVGNERLLEELRITTAHRAVAPPLSRPGDPVLSAAEGAGQGGDFLRLADELRRDGQTVIYIVVDGKPAGLLGIADPIKPSTLEAIRSLHEEGVRIVMLTGDSRQTAEAVARQLGIDEFEADLLPERKLEIVKRLQAEGYVVAMAGDGINDAPALAQANVGIAMGTGTDVAMEAGGITLVKGDLRGLVRARRLSRAALRIIRQNLFFAFVYNSLGVPIAAGVLYPFFGILLSPIIAAAAMSFSSVSVISNSLRLRKVRL